MSQQLADKFGIPMGLLDATKGVLSESDAYQAKVKAHMAKKGVKSLNDMTADQKKKFFNELDSMHKAKNEEVEELDELSKKTLSSHVAQAGAKAIMHNTQVQRSTNAADIEKHSKLASKRLSGAAIAHRKLNVEEVESVEEELKGAMHPDAHKVLKHIKPEHHGTYKPYLKKGTYKGDYKDRAAVLSAAEKAGHVKEEIELEEETKTSGVTVTPATRRNGKQITTHHEHEGQKYKVTSEEDNEDGDLHHTIHKVDHEGKHSNETHYRSIRSHNYSVRPSKTTVVHDKLGKKVSSSLIDAHEKARSSAGKKALHRHEKEMSESVELTQEDLDFIVSLNQAEVVEGQLRNFSPHSDLAGRGRLSGYNKTAAGKKRETDRETERLKDKMKFTKGQGGIAGPKGKLPEEFDLEDFTVEEIEEFMQTEDYDQLDELSKETLGSYVKKRSHDVATQGALTRKHAMDSEAKKKEHGGYTTKAVRDLDDKANRAFMKGWKHRQNIGKAVDKIVNKA